MNQNKNKSLKNIISHEDKEDQIEWLKDLLDICPREINRKSVSQWATEKRILLPGLTPYPGPFRWEVVPYAKEIADCFSEDSLIQKLVFMKGVQIAATVAILENILGYTIDHDPGPTMFMSGDKEMAETAIELRIDRMLESAGIAHKIFSQTEKKHGRKTGDTKSKKEFPGGFLLPVGPNTGAKLRQFSVQKVLFDEVDAYPAEVGEEGDPLMLAERRTDAFEMTRKILYISTPLVDGSSRIKTLYENGDQRKWFVPCKHCGEMQELKFDHLKYDLDEKGILRWDTVRYECEYCSKPWKNDDKIHFLGKGEWRATSQAIEPNYRSYHLSSLYSPVGFRSWESIIQEWIGIKGDQSRLRTFVNTVLGETYQERGEAPPFAMIMLKREDYKVGTLPEIARPLLITMAADVQSDRIEVEVVAWGRDKESWSINYFVFYGDTNDLMSDAWQGLSEALTSEYCGKNVTMAFIDAGYRTSTVYQFCEQFPAGVFPVMGESSNAYGKKYFTLRDVAGFSVKRVDIQTSIFKSELYGYLQKGKPEEGNSYPLGYCHFPVEYGEKYFQMLTAEKRIPVRNKNGTTKLAWVQVRDRNEALDIRVYNMAALSFIADTLQAEIMPDEERLDWPTFWDLIESTNKT